MPYCQERLRTGGWSKSVYLRKIWNRSEFTASTRNSNTYCTATHRHKPLLLSTWPGVVFLARFNNFAQTTGFCWSYTLLLKLPVLMRSCIQHIGQSYLRVNEFLINKGLANDVFWLREWEKIRDPAGIQTWRQQCYLLVTVSAERVRISLNSAEASRQCRLCSLSSTPLQGSKWLNSKSVWLVFRRSCLVNNIQPLKGLAKLTA